MEQVTNAILTAAELHSKLTDTPVNNEFVQRIKTLGAGIFRMVVMGEIKKGKSSFINAFLGVQNLVPVSSDIATSTVFKIHYGAKPAYRVFFEKETGKAPLTIGTKELADYGTENGNPANCKQVDFIEVIHPSPLLRNGLVIIDTPGLGGLFKEHKKITWNYVPKADAVFFVTDSVESPIGLEEINHLRTVLKITPHLYFVQTKASAVDKEAREARRKNNLDILSRAFNTPAEHIPYFVVDSLRKFSADEASSLKKLERSGYPELMSYINGKLLNNQHRILAGKAIALAAPLLDEIRSNLSTRRATLNADSAEKQQQAKEELEAAQKELLKWQQDVMPRLRTEMERGLTKIKQKSMQQAVRLAPHGEIHQQLELLVTEATSKKQLTAVIEKLNSDLPEFASSVLTSVKKLIENETSELLRQMASDTSALDSGEKAIILREDGSQVQVNKNALERLNQKIQTRADSFDMFRTVSMGFGAGVSLSIALGFTIGSVVPIVGNIAGSGLGVLIGGIWGITKAFSIKGKQELEAAKQQAFAAIAQAISSIQSGIHTQLDTIFTEIQYNISDTLAGKVKSYTKELDKRRTEIAARSKMTEEAINAERSKLQQSEAQLRAILKSLEPWN